MFSQLSNQLESAFKKLRGHGRISESNITEAMREVRMALLEADVDFKVAKDFIALVKEKALGTEVLNSVTPGQQIVKIFHDELTQVLGGDSAPLDLNPPARIVMAGLNGAGKTTSSAKLAQFLKKEGRRPVLVACDLIRPAAIDQLVTLAKQIDIPVYAPSKDEKDVLKVAAAGLRFAAEQQATVTIFDTAGRQDLDRELIEELKKLCALLEPREVLLVADSATGQQAVNVAKTFQEAVKLTGIVLTRVDGDARGGAALSMRTVTGLPVKFIGEGEKLNQLSVFHPQRMAGRILGMGDVVSLVEAAAENIDQNEAAQMADRLKRGEFDFNDLLSQMKMLRKLGPLENLLGMLPGMSKLGPLSVDEKQMRRTEAIVLSMTPKERSRPEIINGSRRKRIAKGSGTSVPAVNQLLRQVSDMRKLMRSKGKMRKMMKQMGGGGTKFGF
ncbi:MAG: signal recognition particle subunit SRP54 [Verrucomicrobia bacterium]|nr:MAG: signal recognition particle subunit SRP54 [Verrucomicrobiota bacterium]